MSAFGLASQLGVDRAAAQTYMERYFSRYPGVREYMQNTRELARRQGFVETISGRRLWIPEINSPNGMRRQGAERAAINAPMQGTRSEEHTSELQSLMRISYAFFCLNKKNKHK